MDEVGLSGLDGLRLEGWVAVISYPALGRSVRKGVVAHGARLQRWTADKSTISFFSEDMVGGGPDGTRGETSAGVNSGGAGGNCPVVARGDPEESHSGRIPAHYAKP